MCCVQILFQYIFIFGFYASVVIKAVLLAIRGWHVTSCKSFLIIISIVNIQDHLQEVLDKWDSIDDEIWAKIVVLERNRRVAKAYARAPVLTVNGSDQGFDGFRIGLSGFENPMRDIGTEESLKQINQV